MNNVLSLTCMALLAIIASVHPQLLSVEPPTWEERANEAISNKQRDTMAKLRRYFAVLTEVEESNDPTQIEEIGPNFNEEQFLRRLRNDARAAMRRKCTKISGDDKAYDEAQEAKLQAKRCISSWIQTEGLLTDFEVAKVTGNNKPLLKKVCEKRGGLFTCIENHKAPISRCLYPSQNEKTEKVLRITKKMLDLICTQSENDFALFEADGEAVHCLTPNRVKITTCLNKALYSGARRIVEKFIENEHFEIAMDAEDCKEFDAAKSCLVSSVENCENPTVKDMVSSAIQIIRDETECAKNN